MQNVLMPELGEGIVKASVVCWHFKQGDQVKNGDDIVEVVTDKASFNVSATATGILDKILIEEGQDIKVGETLAIIENER